MSRQRTQPTRRQEWRDSEAKKHLLQDLDIGLITDDMDPRVAYNRRPEFQEFEFRTFRDRLRDYQKKKAEKGLRAYSERQEMHDDLRNHVPQTHDHRGIPRWEGSEAQRLLAIDVEAGTDRSMTPLELWRTKPAYQAFDKDVFRGHIYQERRRQKFLKWLDTKDS
jgi:hypothetical protein